MPIRDFAATVSAVLTTDADFEIVGSFSAKVSGILTTSAAMGSVDRCFSATVSGQSVLSAKVTSVRAYLSRPVLLPAINWNGSVTKRFSYDLRQTLLGYNIARIEPLQLATAQGFEFDLLLASEQAIAEQDEFGDLLQGRLNGFWIPSPFDAMEIASRTSSTVFTIKGQGLAAYFDQHPSQYLVFQKPGQIAEFAKITAVASGGPGSNDETVTIDAALTAVLDTTWEVRKLLYVRLAADVEEASFFTDNRQTRTVRVVELPTEYADLETGVQPVYLYEFSGDFYGTTIYWRQTGLSQNVIAGGNTFTSAPIEHGSLKRSMAVSRSSLQIKSWIEAGSPFEQFIPFSAQFPLTVSVYETTLANPQLDLLLFKGRVSKPQSTGRRIEAEAVGFLFDTKFPRFRLMPRCNYILFDDNCGLDRNDWVMSVRIHNADSANNPSGFVIGRQVKLTLDGTQSPDRFSNAAYNAYSLGWLVTGSGASTEIRSIKQNAATLATEMIARLNLPLNKAAISNPLYSVTAKLYPGCDGISSTCKSFGNFRKWGGHYIAAENPTLSALEAKTASGNKK